MTLSGAKLTLVITLLIGLIITTLIIWTSTIQNSWNEFSVIAIASGVATFIISTVQLTQNSKKSKPTFPENNSGRSTIEYSSSHDTPSGTHQLHESQNFTQRWAGFQVTQRLQVKLSTLKTLVSQTKELQHPSSAIPDRERLASLEKEINEILVSIHNDMKKAIKLNVEHEASNVGYRIRDQLEDTKHQALWLALLNSDVVEGAEGDYPGRH